MRNQTAVHALKPMKSHQFPGRAPDVKVKTAGCFSWTDPNRSAAKISVCCRGLYTPNPVVHGVKVVDGAMPGVGGL